MNKNSNSKNDPTILVVANTLQQLATRSPLSKKQNRELFNDLCNFYPQTGLQNVLKPCLFNAIDSGYSGNLEFILKKITDPIEDIINRDGDNLILYCAKTNNLSAFSFLHETYNLSLNSVNFNNEKYGRLSSVIEYVISNEDTNHTFIKYLQEKTDLFKDSINTLISLAPSKTLQDILKNGDPEYYGKLTTPEQLHKYLNAELHITFNSAHIIDKYTADWNVTNNDGCNVLHLLTKEIFNLAIKNNGLVESQHLQNLNQILKDITTVAQINFEQKDAFGHTPETYLNEAAKLEQQSTLREANTEKQFLEAKLIFSNPYPKNKTTLKI